MAALFSTVSMLLSILFAVVVAVYFVQPLRVKAYRLFVKFFAKRMEEEEAHELRKKMNLGEGEVNMGELLGEKNKIASGETTAVDSALDELRSR